MRARDWRLTFVACWLGWICAPWAVAQQESGLLTLVEVEAAGESRWMDPEAIPSPSDSLEQDESQGENSNIEDELDALLEQDLSSLRRTSVAPALDIEVSTVARQKSTVGRSPAAVFVVNEEMIRRSGARTVPEVLRLVPGLHVAHINGNAWSISSRGFADRFANKLLVQIDGRTVYTPLFGGVFWDVQDLLLDDIERIEVIRGPGSTIWGANAINGVINIITKSASKTHGVYAHAGVGTLQEGFAGARIGSRSQGGVDWRVSGKWYERDRFVDPTGRVDDDGVQQGRVGFRSDWQPCRGDRVTFQGDFYSGSNNLAFDRPSLGFMTAEEEVAGGNVLGRWSRVFDDDSDVSLQLYYDRTDRINSGFDQDTNMIDIDFQHRFSPRP
ncbi:MAG: TonB-dependent receptor plug domain-containing protein, partial [Pirellulales bacterium]|nr:TonB-dependent receptor plug domain-containing protein [Pirellulales bacterium]